MQLQPHPLGLTILGGNRSVTNKGWRQKPGTWFHWNSLFCCTAGYRRVPAMAGGVSEAVTSELSLEREMCWLGDPELPKGGSAWIKA